MPQLLFSVKDAAHILGVSTNTIYTLLETKQLPGKKIGGSWRIHYRDLGLTRDDIHTLKGSEHRA
ncbi:MAG: helix-turn-helix domain-containing protein [Actinomycetaceae bacterium]|nr:helix-turn-helix domain-containing protein [Arcanobacterium sp.]MDD7505581.1 helix-turn-helix domain-containing protein [Actinomycetaceae bacterium]MDY6143800.1 helix-turn-helix domain-containing protein [Arcanobacterium sp.]